MLFFWHQGTSWYFHFLSCWVPVQFNCNIIYFTNSLELSILYRVCWYLQTATKQGNLLCTFFLILGHGLGFTCITQHVVPGAVRMLLMVLHGVTLSLVQNLVFVFVEVQKVSCQSVSDRLWCQLIAVLPSSIFTTPPNLVSSRNLMKMHFMPFSRLLMKTLGGICHSINPWKHDW